MKKKTYLVRGGAGFIGSSIVRRLVEEKQEVRVLDNNLRSDGNRLKGVFSRIEFVKADIRDTKAVRKACRAVDTVCHLAYVNGTEFFYKKPELVLDIGVKGMVNILDSCIEERVPEMILVSTSEVYQTPPVVPTKEEVPLSVPDILNPRYSYGGGKIISELMAINYGRKHFKKVAIIRPHNVYGPDMGLEHVIPQFMSRMKKLSLKSKSRLVKFPIQGTGRETRAFTYIDDFTDGFMLVIKKGRHLGIYNVGTEEEIRIGNVASLVADYFGKKVLLVPRKLPKGSTERRCPDITKIKKLGYRQRVPFRKGFKITAGWYDRNLDKKNKRKIGGINGESAGIYPFR